MPTNNYICKGGDKTCEKTLKKRTCLVSWGAAFFLNFFSSKNCCAKDCSIEIGKCKSCLTLSCCSIGPFENLFHSDAPKYYKKVSSFSKVPI